MQIKPIKHDLILASPTEGYVRSPGLHMSAIYGPYYAKYDKRFKDKGDGPDKVKMELGTSFEEVLEPVLAARLLGERPGEFTTLLHNIIYSPDYLFYEEDGTVLGEFKLTWYSSKGAPRGKKFAKWISQIKLYAYHLGLTKARLYVLFVNHDYKPPAPKLLAWELTFTEEELAEEWEIMLRFAKEEGIIPNGKKRTRK